MCEPEKSGVFKRFCARALPIGIGRAIFPGLIVWLLLFYEILGNMWIVIVYEPACDAINFKIKVYFCMTKKSRQKLNSLRTKRAFKIKQKAFFITFKVLSLKLIKQFVLEGESPTLNETI